MADLKHRLATAYDLDLLAEWNRQLIEDEGSRNPVSVAELRDRMSDWIMKGGYRAVLFHHGEPAVAYALYRENDDEVFLRQFFVARDHRRRGLGRAAMNILKAELWPGDKALAVDVLAHNATAYTFWRECGYEAEYIRMRRNPGR